MTADIKNMTSGTKLNFVQAEPTVAVGYAMELVNFAVANGADRAAMFDSGNLSDERVTDPDHRLPFADYVSLMQAAKELSGDPAFALRLGAEHDFHTVSVVGLLCYAAPTMGEALQALNRYGRLVAEFDMPEPGNRFQLLEDAEGLWLTDTQTGALDFPEMTEETWSRFIAETTRNFPGFEFVKRVCVPHEAPPYADEYERLWKVPVTFGSERNGMLINSDWPGIPLHKPNPYVFGILSAHAGKLLESLEQSKTVRGQLEAALIPILHTDKTNMDHMASLMGMSRQTLYRRLRDEGATFEQVLDDLRHQMALHYLEGKQTTVYETATLLGFSDASSFSRAFKRWTGTSPKSRKG